jgi:hypothetical protein
MNIFAERELRDYLEQRKLSVIQSIDNEADDYLLNINESDYIQYKSALAYVEPLQIHEDQIYVSSSEKMISVENFPDSFSFRIREGNSYKKDVIKFHVPFSGNAELLKCSPSSRMIWSMDVASAIQEFCFEIINFSDDSEVIKEKKDSNLANIMKQLENVTSEVDFYNSGIEFHIKQAFDARKQRILAKSSLLASLGVPIKKAENASPTFSIPAPQARKKIVVSKPIVNETGFKPEPTLDEPAYHDILKLIHDVGKEFERLPSLYAGKEEEHLRDHFLMMLEPNFQGTATGETFNKTGRTDILLRYEGTNVFIAECKFWKGKKVFLSTISQLLGYLTWRDSKAAVIMFVPNKEFTSVLETAKNSISEHSNYLSFVNPSDETWLNYKFHLNDDRNRLLKLAVMLYHTPR